MAPLTLICYCKLIWLIQKWCKNTKSDWNPPHRYSSESSQWGLPNEYQYDSWVLMIFKNLCIPEFWMQESSSLEMSNNYFSNYLQCFDLSWYYHYFVWFNNIFTVLHNNIFTVLYNIIQWYLIFLFSDVAPSDTGIYSCNLMGQNTQGVIKLSHSVVVKGKSHFPFHTCNPYIPHITTKLQKAHCIG